MKRLNSFKYGIRIFLKALRQESLNSILKNVLRYFFQSNSNTYRIYHSEFLKCQITHFYCTPSALEVDGWYELKFDKLKTLFLSVNEKKFDLEIDILKPETAKTYNLRTEYVGFYGLINQSISENDSTHLCFITDSQRIEKVPVIVNQPNYLNENELKKVLPKPLQIKTEFYDSTQKVTIIIPFKDQIELLKKALFSIAEKTTIKNYEILLVDNNSKEEKTQEYLDSLVRKPKIKIINAPYDFNFSKLMNDAVKVCSSEYIVLLNNDIEIITNGWLIELIETLDERIGCVGPLLIYPDQTIQHAGIVIPDKEPIYIMNHHPKTSVLDLSFYEYQAITGACMVMKRSYYEKVQGMDEQLPVVLNDVDFCLKLREEGLKVGVLNSVEMIHHKSLSRGKHDAAIHSKRSSKEKTYFRKKWKHVLKQPDPFYPNIFSNKYPDYRLRK